MDLDASTPPHYKPDRLAYWYFRLNGFMTIEKFLVHPETGSCIGTDVDILATRFTYREENVVCPMADDPQVAECETFANVVIAEIKTGGCDLNGPWTNPVLQNMERVLRSIGCASKDEIPPAAQSLYEHGKWSNGIATVRLFAVGEESNDHLVVGREQQIEWADVIDFCVRRFKDYRRQKVSNGQWTSDGKQLRKLALRNDTPSIRRYFGLRDQEMSFHGE
jgi:hypothetical protein